MEILNDAVTTQILKTLNKKKLFRYDCNKPEESEVSVLENNFAKYVGSQYAVAMNSCSSCLFVSLLCAGIKHGDDVAIPAFTFIAVPSSIVHAGANPVLIEVTKDYVIDLDDFESKAKAGNIKALMLSYMRGRIPDLDRVIQLCEKYNIVLIEDSAHSLGVLYKGRQTGRFGITGSFSMQSYKMLDSGEGGILVTDDKDIAFKSMLYAGCYEHNWKNHFGTQDDIELLKQMTSSIPAYNFRMSNLSASALIPQIGDIESRVQYLNENYRHLVNILSQSKYIRIPDFTSDMRPAPDSIQWEFLNLNPKQIETIQQELANQNIAMDIFTGDNARCFWNWSFFDQKNDCPYTRSLIQKTVDMKLRVHLTTRDIEQIGNSVLKAIKSVTG